MVATVFAGSAILVTLLEPKIGEMLQLSHPLTILTAALFGAVAAIPVAILVVKAIPNGKTTA